MMMHKTDVIYTKSTIDWTINLLKLIENIVFFSFNNYKNIKLKYFNLHKHSSKEKKKWS